MGTSEILLTLEQFASEDRLAFMQRTCPTSMRMLGVTMPQLQTVLREARSISKTWDHDRIHAASLELVGCGVHEAHLLGLEWAAASKKHIGLYSADQLRAFNSHMDNWVSVDTYAVKLLGQGWRVGKIEDAEIHAFLNSPDLWQRRIGVVCTVALNLRSRGGTGDVERTLEVCKMAMHEREDMLVKAVSWALRQLIVHDVGAVQDFVIVHKDALHNRVLREVQTKLDTGTKRGS